MRTDYSLVNGELRISRDDPTFEWQGRVDSMVVSEVRPVPDGSGVVVLLEAPPGTAQVRNLVKVDNTAHIAWRGELPADTSGDCFVSFIILGDGSVSAATWSGFRVTLSRETGQVLDQRFTK